MWSLGCKVNESPDSNRFTLVTTKSENDVRLRATLDNQNPTGSPVGAVRNKRILSILVFGSTNNIGSGIKPTGLPVG